MIKQASLGSYEIGGIYQHYNNKKYYMIDNVAKLHDSIGIFLIIYHQCDEHGTYETIREHAGTEKETIVFQPFATDENRWIEEMRVDDLLIPRFKLIKSNQI